MSEVYDILGEPETHSVTLRGEIIVDPGIPRYLVYPVDASDILPSYLLPQIRIADFGESFCYHEEAPRVTGIPRAYCAPEAVLAHTSGPASDLWSLGCLFFEARLDRKIFDINEMFRRSVQTYILTLTLILGRLPEPWWGNWARRHEFFRCDDDDDDDDDDYDEDDEDEEDDAAANYDEQPIGTHDRLEKQPGKLKSFMPCGLKEPRSIREAIEVRCYSATWDGKELVKDHDMAAAEIDAMADLLGQLVRYVPEERVSAQDIANHRWYSI